MAGMRRTWFVIAGVGLAAALPAFAAEGGRHTVRLGAGYMVPTEDSSAAYDMFDYASFRFDTDADEALGASLAYEFRATPSVGIELGAGYYQPDLGVQVFVTGFDEAAAPEEFLVYDWKESLKMMPVTLGVNVHMNPAAKTDVYAGLEVAYITYDDWETVIITEIDERFRLEFENEFTWGLKAGVNVPLGKHWLFSAQLEYLDARAKVERTVVSFDDGPDPNVMAPVEAEEDELPYLEGESLDPKPFVVNVGVAYRF